MSDYTQIHETVIRDIMDVIDDAKEAASNVKNKNFDGMFKSSSARSITRSASDLVLVFPFMCDSTVSIETANMVSKAIERNCVSMLEMLFASATIVKHDEAEKNKSGEDYTGQDFLKRFHTNINIGAMTIDDFINDIKESVEVGDIKVTNPQQYNAVMKDLEGMSYHLPDSLRESSLNDFSVIDRYGSQHVLKEVRNQPKPNDLKNPNDLAKFYKDMADFQKTRILDSDVKKANEVAPTMMVVNFYVEGKEQAVSFVCGVKCRLIPVDPYDIANHIMIKNSDRNVLLNFIRATTKEISFFKDFLFAIDRAKVDAMAQSKRGSSNKMWKVLERRAVKSRLKRALSKPNDVTSITTLGMSQELVEYIKKANGIDVEKAMTIEPIMEGYNLMGVVLINEADEVAKFMWDTGEGNYESVSFTNMQRETNGGEYKKAVNLISKMYR